MLGQQLPLMNLDEKVGEPCVNGTCLALKRKLLRVLDCVPGLLGPSIFSLTLFLNKDLASGLSSSNFRNLSSVSRQGLTLYRGQARNTPCSLG